MSFLTLRVQILFFDEVRVNKDQGNLRPQNSQFLRESQESGLVRAPGTESLDFDTFPLFPASIRPRVLMA
jgi:hypothetical protein